ncbi:beta-1,6-glucan active enzyme, family GH16 [Tribonema minus]|uniref:Beta-1,6-glucan active enzyme, family GH16 n=1 Tax=Tribonema minus TaxID=303371 RepID=A0A835YN37_9STRA|nr:beta-1,6-glucan active enzyme, family GH16 [Tribonema minus]
MREAPVLSPRRKRWVRLAALGLLPCALASWIDPDTPNKHTTMKSLKDGRIHKLIMSDEFNVKGRTFADGEDPMWTAELHSDDAQSSAGYGSLHYYNDSQVVTSHGCLNITTTSEKTQWKGYNPYKKKYEVLFKNFKSGLITTWNKFCFTGGIIEMRAILPGEHNIGGLWPAFWLLGNLGRATYEASTNLVWPWSYNRCNRKLQLGQEISACNGVKHFGMHAHQGRGSTEIDIIEVMAGKPGYPEIIEWDKIGLPYMSATLQVAPGIEDHRPEQDHQQQPENTWYEGMSYGPNTTQNFHFYGLLVDKTLPMEPVYRSEKQSYRADGISAITRLARTHFNDFHTYKLEWRPGADGGYLAWYLDDELLFEIDQASLDPYGSQIPDEPSYVILNTAVASSWGFPIPCPPGCACECFDCNDDKCACSFFEGFCDTLPAHFLVDYVRVFQDESDPLLTQTCDPPTHPTTAFIKAHPDRYLGNGKTEPLEKLVRGGGSCKVDDDCAGHGMCRGSWFWRSCECEEGWVGPKCRAFDKFDDFTYHHQVHLKPEPLAVPLLLRLLGGAVAIAVVSATVLAGVAKSRQRKKVQQLAESKRLLAQRG